MGNYVFKWEHPEANEVFVTGTFDDWGKTQKLDRKGEFFEKDVALPNKEKILYKFVVDGNWTTNSHLATETDHNGNVNNVLYDHEIIHPSHAAALSSAAPLASTAALAGAVPKESEKSVVPGSFPETPATEPAAFSVNPIPATEGAGNPIKLAPGEPVPDPSTLTSNTIQSTVRDDPELKSASEPSAFSVNPIPATAGIGNPIKLAPGEPVPDPSTLTSNTIQSTVRDDPELKSASEPSAFSVNPIPATEGAGNPIKLAPGEPVPDPSTLTSNTIQSTVRDDPELKSVDGANESVFSVNPIAATPGIGNPTSSSKAVEDSSLFALPAVGGAMIPESSLPMGAGTSSDVGPGAGILTSSAAANSTTAGLAGAVPLEPRGVPEVVKESQEEAAAPAEASANPVAVDEKKSVEEELKAKVPEAAPAAESGFPTAKIAGIVGGAAAIAGGAAALAYEKASATAADAKTAYSGMVSPAEEKNLAAPTDTGVASSGFGSTAIAGANVPAVVRDSINKAHVNPEATVNKEAVIEKSAVEAELESKIKPSEAVGEHAPTFGAASTSAVAPTPAAEDSVPEVVKESIAEAHVNPEATTNPEAVAEKSAMESELESKIKPSEAVGEHAPTFTAATTDKAPEATKNGTPTPAVTTGVATTSIPTKSEAGPATPSKQTAESTSATPTSTAASTNDTPDSKTDKKKKRRSVFIQKLKKIFD